MWGVFFNEIAGPQNCNFIKKRLQHRLFPVKFAKRLRAPSFTEHLQWLLVKCSGFQTPANMLFCEFRKICKNIFSFDRIREKTASCVFL